MKVDVKEIASVAPPELLRNDNGTQAKACGYRGNDEAVKRLLDVVSSIISDEYIVVAKQNPNVFKNGGLQ